MLFRRQLRVSQFAIFVLLARVKQHVKRLLALFLLLIC
jgi:hypothetical protein